LRSTSSRSVNGRLDLEVSGEHEHESQDQHCEEDDAPPGTAACPSS
jgi:hypothetical protein